MASSIQENKRSKSCYQGKRSCTELIYPLKLFSSSNRLALSIWPTGKSSKLYAKRKWLTWAARTDEII